MKKNTRKVPQSVKVKRRIDTALAEQEVMHKRHIQALQRKYGEQISLLEINAGPASKPSVIVHNSDIDWRENSQKIAEVVRRNKSQFLPIRKSGKRSGLIVANWRDSWKWLTIWGSATIVGINAFYASLPPEFIDSLPEHTQSTINVIGGIALLLGRFINQSKPKALPPAENQDV